MAGSKNCNEDDVSFSQRVPEEITTKKHRFSDSRDQTLTVTSLSSSRQRMPNRDQVHLPPLPLPTLPFELIVEILSRLPVKFLLQLRAVCKSWKSLISDPQFVRKHLCMSTMDPNFSHHRMIFSFSGPKLTLKSCCVNSVFNDLPTTAITLKYPLKFRTRYDMMVGSCDGLLCFAVNQSRVIIWNPSTRTFKKSPYLNNNRRPKNYTIFGFGYDNLNDTYKVVSFFCYDSDGRSTYKTEAKVYNLGADSWRSIQEFPYGVPFDEPGKFVNGTLNWLTYPTIRFPRVIISLDLGKESYQEIWQPDSEEVVFSRSLGVLRNCLCILYHYEAHADLWLMNDYGVKESWIKYRIAFMEVSRYIPYVKLHCISKNGEALLEFNSKVIIYNCINTTFKHADIEDVNNWLDAEVYVESLISPCC